MHSSFLRGTDFQLRYKGQPDTHARFFTELAISHRLGLFAPDGVGGIGATTLVMAHVTAFYDRYREEAADFFAYPDYYSFQSCAPLTDYAMFDIWPQHKNVFVEMDAPSRLDAINDRAINILVLPDKPPEEHSFQPAQLESARRNVRICYVYSPTDQVTAPDLTICTANQSIQEWAVALFERGGPAAEPTRAKQKSNWLAQHSDSDGRLHQSFRIISLEEALQLL